MPEKVLYKIFPLGLDALTIEFGQDISEKLNRKVLKLAEYFQENAFAGLTEAVPAYSSLTLFFDFLEVRKNFPEFSTAFSAVKKIVEDALPNLEHLPEKSSSIVEIPISFAEEFSPDLEFVARYGNLSSEEVIRIFLSGTYRVFMLGFLPGFAYMGKVDEKIAAPRKRTPRKFVPQGSVGIAGRQTGIYSLDSPGGWQIIGKTETKLFKPQKEPPAFLQAGDIVKFVRI
jgi:inhibitor of KinA